MAGLLYRIGRFAARRSWVVITSWLLILVLAAGGYAAFHGTTSSTITIPETPTTKVTDELAERFPSASGGTGTVVLRTTDDEKFTAEQREQISSLLAGIKKLDGVSDVVDPFATQAERDKQADQVKDGKAQISDGRAQLDAAQKKLDAGSEQLAAAQKKADAGQKQLDAAVAQAKEAGTYEAAKPTLDAQQAQLDAGQKEIDGQKAELAKNQKTLDGKRDELDAQAKKLDESSALMDLASDLRTVSKDGTAATATVQFTAAGLDVPLDLTKEITTRLDDADISGVDIYPSSELSREIPAIFGVGEAIGVVVAAIVLFVMLGTLIGAGLPLLSAVLGVAVAVLGALAFSSVVDFISVTPVLGIMLGLAVGIDYSLFIVNRHRRQLKRGMAVDESIGLANGTAGNAVVFAGSTVVVALVALNVTGIPFLGLMGTVGAVAVAVAICVAVTFTPAMLGLVGTKILSRKERGAVGTSGSAVKVPTKPMSTVRAVVTLVVGVLALGAIALPATAMRLGLPDGSSESTSSSQYKAYKTIEEKFGAGQNGPLLVVATLQEAPADDDALLADQVDIATALGDHPDVAAVAPIGASKDKELLAFQVIPVEGPTAESTADLVHDLRAATPTAGGQTVTLGVAGNTSASIDISERLQNVLPVYLAVVVGLSFLILVLVFRSILVPLTATLGYVLSLFAAFGALTAIFQWGWLSSVFGVHDPGPILSFLPIIVMGILFGLAMDYQLFLVSGMRESYVHGSEPRLAVQRGLHAGRAVVTAAAIIMISVFGGFIFSESSMIRPIGFALAFGVLVDAFVVRMLLIPASMHLLGRHAWWLPRWLDRILPDVDVEGAQLERTHPVDGHPDDEPAGASADPATRDGEVDAPTGAAPSGTGSS